MFGPKPDHIAKRHVHEVPSLGSLDDIRLPSAPIYTQEIIEPHTETVRAAVLDNSAKLDDLTNKALAFFDELLSQPMSEDTKTLAAQESAARTILTTQLRVDDSRLKRKDSDTLSKLLKRLEEEDDKFKRMKVVSA